MLFDSLSIEERLPSQEGRRAASRRVVNWIEEVDCVTLVLRRQKFGCPRVLEPAKNRSPLIAHHSPLREESVVRYPRCWIDASYQLSLNQGLWSIPVCSIAEDNLVLSLDFVGLWPWLVKGRYFLWLLFSKKFSPFCNLLKYFFCDS